MKNNLLIATFSILALLSCTNTEKQMNKQLANQLDSVLLDDQLYRSIADSIEQKYGYESKEALELWQKIHDKDSVNAIKVTAIIDKYGWLGPDIIGENGNAALFFVIQHADLKIQEKYLPLMKEAVKKGNAAGCDLALLVDRIEMSNGRPQIYGSQIQMKDNKYVIYPILDEKNVNKRRAAVGLTPIETYVKKWNIDYTLPN